MNPIYKLIEDNCLVILRYEHQYYITYEPMNKMYIMNNPPMNLYHEPISPTLRAESQYTHYEPLSLSEHALSLSEHILNI